MLMWMFHIIRELFNDWPSPVLILPDKKLNHNVSDALIPVYEKFTCLDMTNLIPCIQL
jgi:hypothetical protein